MLYFESDINLEHLILINNEYHNIGFIMNKFIDWMCDKTNMLIESTMSGVSNWTFYDTDKVPTKNENLKIVIDFFNDYLKNVIEQYRINPKYLNVTDKTVPIQIFVHTDITDNSDRCKIANDLRNYLHNPIHVKDNYYVQTTENWVIDTNKFHNSKMSISVMLKDNDEYVELQKFYFRMTPKKDEKANKVVSQVQNSNVLLKRCLQ